jgi:hypothetical protein
MEKKIKTCRLFEAVDVFHEKSWTEVNLKFDRSAAKINQRNRATKLLELFGNGLRGMTRRNTKIESGKNWMRFL